MTILRSRLMRRAAMALTVAAASGVTYVAFASHQFSDVPPTAIYHNAVDWMVNRGVTTGCDIGLYCPDANVTRASMALFMNRLGVALTPNFLPTSVEDNSLDFTASSSLYRCRSAATYTPTYPQRAFIHAQVSLAGAGTPIDWGTKTAYSTDGGVTWIVTPSPNWYMRTTSGVNIHSANPAFGYVDLNPGTGYRFAVHVQRFTGPNTTGEFICAVQPQVLNRNPAAGPPFAPEAEPSVAEPGTTNAE